MSDTENKRWSYFLLAWGISALLQFFFFRFLFFKVHHPATFVAMFSAHLGACLVYFILTEEKSKKRGRVWPLQFFFLSFFLPGISLVFLPFLWAQKVEGHSFKDYGADLKELIIAKANVEIKMNAQEKLREELDLQPYADIMAGQDLELKRGAIERLVELKNKEAIKILEKYRSNDSSELRFYILSALHRVRQEFEEELAAAKSEMQKHVYKVSARVYLAKVYLQYIQSGLLDRVTQKTYLEEAAFHLRECLKTEYAHTHAFEVLLEVLSLQKEYSLAELLLEEALQKKWCNSDYYFQKKAELFYNLQDYPKLKTFISSFPLAQLQSKESTQIYYGWGGGSYAQS